LLLADEYYLNRLLANLVDNAIKYTRKGSVSVIVGKKGRQASLRVKDTGIGIAKQELKSIFDRFYRADKSRSSEGYGLGLGIVKSVVNAHGGRITVKSSPGKGSEFTVFFPSPD